jgi:RNA polymerase sigma factor (TIGR02999 family)
MAPATEGRETLGERMAREFEQLRAEGLSTQEIYERLYADLRVLARKKVGPADRGMSSTSVVHKLWFRVAQREPFTWESGQHFVRSVALAMQNLLIDSARERRGESLPTSLPGTRDDWETRLDVSEALKRLADEDERQAEIVRLVIIAGFTQEEVAEVLDCSLSTVKKEFRKAKAWLKDDIDGGPKD